MQDFANCRKRKFIAQKMQPRETGSLSGIYAIILIPFDVVRGVG